MSDCNSSSFRGRKLAPLSRFIASVLLLGCAASFTACSGISQSATSTTSTVANSNVVPKISLSPDSSSVTSGATLQYTALIRDVSNTAVIWSASAGTISNTGLFTAPKVQTAQTFSVTATSVADKSVSAKVVATVLPVQTASALKIVTSNLASATSGTSYTAALSAAGGETPYNWTLSSGSLPAGLQLENSTGVISGIPSQTGTFSFTVAVKDAANNQIGQPMSLSVAANTASNFDGPAELPRIYMQSAMSDTPAPGKVTQLASGGDLQSALNNASCGDTISLQAGGTFAGMFTFPQKSCDSSHWIIVRTSAADSSLPAEGTRITPCYAGVASLPGRPALHCTSTKNVMAKLIFTNKTGYGPVVFANGANHYRLIGLEITRSAGTSLVSNLITPDANSAVNNIVLDRLWVHGTAQDETTRGVYLSGVTSVAIIDSFFTDFHCVSITGTCTDAQTIAGGSGDLPMGIFKIVDNFLEASGENIIFGGSQGTVTPTDIEIRRNHFFKPLIWMPGYPGFVGGVDGNPFIVKNHFETKNAQRILFEANILENNWGGVGQYGYSISITPKNQAQGTLNVCPICQVTDVTIRYTTISHVGGAFVIANAASSAGGVPAAGERYSIHDVIADDINDVTYNGRGTFAQISTVPQPNIEDLQIDHVTILEPKVLFNLGADVTEKMVNFKFTNSIVNAGLSPFTTTGGGTTNCAYNPVPNIVLPACFAPVVFSKNAIIAPPSSAPASLWPAQNFFPASVSAVQFVKYNNGNGGDYHLQSTSPYKGAGTDGRDLGADVNTLMTDISGVE